MNRRVEVTKGGPAEAVMMRYRDALAIAVWAMEHVTRADGGFDSNNLVEEGSFLIDLSDSEEPPPFDGFFTPLDCDGNEIPDERHIHREDMDVQWRAALASLRASLDYLEKAKA